MHREFGWTGIANNGFRGDGIYHHRSGIESTVSHFASDTAKAFVLEPGTVSHDLVLIYAVRNVGLSFSDYCWFNQASKQARTRAFHIDAGVDPPASEF